MNQAINLIDNLAVRKERLHVSHGVTRTDDGDDDDYYDDNDGRENPEPRNKDSITWTEYFSSQLLLWLDKLVFDNSSG